MTQQFDKHYMQLLINSSPFLKDNNLRICELRDGYARMEIDIKENILNEHGIVHGGIIFTLADNTAAASDVCQGQSCVTLNSTINYIRPATGKMLYAISETVFKGRTTGVYDVSVFNDEDTLVAKGSFTMFFLEDRTVGEKIQHK